MARPYLRGSSGGIKSLASTQSLSMADSGKVFICSQVVTFVGVVPVEVL